MLFLLSHTDYSRVIGNKLDLRAGVNCVDMGCGIGGVMRDLVDTGVNLTGITIAANEVEMGNIEFRKMGLDTKCRLVEGDCQAMPFSDSTQDAAYAIYSLKYFAKLDAVMSEVARILKPHGKFLIYDLIKTERYNENNEEHRNIIEGLEYACGMPSLHTKEELVQTAAKFGLVLKEHEDLEKTNNTPYHYCFSHSQLFMWLVESPIIGESKKGGSEWKSERKIFLKIKKLRISF
uniref:SAM_MT_ERG6_SMT domain-containing protein n=1 Tax=Heterorhabditis bacteriophora TaxID=37862 RepID=A0A1I7XBC9_HETBA